MRLHVPLFLSARQKHLWPLLILEYMHTKTKQINMSIRFVCELRKKQEKKNKHKNSPLSIVIQHPATGILLLARVHKS